MPKYECLHQGGGGRNYVMEVILKEIDSSAKICERIHLSGVCLKGCSEVSLCEV